jgi:hypothetical protein
MYACAVSAFTNKWDLCYAIILELLIKVLIGHAGKLAYPILYIKNKLALIIDSISRNDKLRKLSPLFFQFFQRFIPPSNFVYFNSRY